MLSNPEGKLLVYASTFADYTRRLKSISSAAEKTARMLNLNFKIVTFSKKFAPIYVYYKNGDDEPVPLYCAYDGESDMHQVCRALRNMLFVLSFHPKYQALRDARKEIMQFS
jgi:hypothetical protein